MSKHDLLTVEETAQARAQGWLLTRVFDGPKNSLQILPVQFSSNCPSAEHAARFVSAKAMQGDQLAIKAMTAVVRDGMAPPPAARKKSNLKEKA